jgi:eukaryotic-like serine/threonine-protein kinase
VPKTRPESPLPDDRPSAPPASGASAAAPTASLVLHSGLQRIFDAALDDATQSQAPTLTNVPGGPESAPTPPDIPGYTVLEHLGGGGMGDVWRVTDALDRELALKTIRVDRMTPAARDRFLSEAKAMSRVEHPHIAPVRHYQVHENTPYFLMDVYPTTLQKRLSEYQADPAKAVRLMIGVAEAVGAMHAKGYIHRDLKPGNVLIAADGTPKVSDLGLAKALSEPPSEIDDGAAGASAETKPVAQAKTMTGAVMGTRPYMAPEQAAGRVNDANPRWDVFALGVMLHELLTGRRPPSSEMPELLLEEGQPDNPPPSKFNARLDPRLEALIRKCLDRDEHRRHADGDELATDLRNWLGPVEPRPTTERPRARWGWMAAGGLTLAIAAAAAMFWPRDQGQPPPPAEPGEERLKKARAALVERLGRGETVELMGEKGHPAYYRLLGQQAEDVPIQNHEVFTVATQRTVLVELIPTGACPNGFEMTAKVQVTNSHERAGRFGLFGARDPDLPADGPDHVFARWEYTESLAGLDRPPPQGRTAQPGPAGKYQLGVAHYVNSDINRSPVAFTWDFQDYFPGVAPGPREPYPERTIGWTIDPTAITVRWDGKPVGRAQIADLNAAWRAVSATKLPATRIVAGGAAGLVVIQGTARFRSVVVRPLP